jgi:hypothetical protein
MTILLDDTLVYVWLALLSAVTYLCVKGINFASANDFSIGFWNYIPTGWYFCFLLLICNVRILLDDTWVYVSE